MAIILDRLKPKKKKKKLSALAKLKKVLAWYENFAVYVQHASHNLHDEACEYADKTENAIKKKYN